MNTSELLTSPKSWTEDYPHENGKYVNHCRLCDSDFMGHKRRVVCKECYAKPKTDYINKNLKHVSKEDLLSALHDLDEKHKEDRRERSQAITEALNGGPDPLIAYLRRESLRQDTEFRLVIRSDRSAYIHPLGRDGETFDFKI